MSKEKEAKPFNRKKFIIMWSAIAAVILVFAIVVSVLATTTFDALFTRVFGSTESTTSETGADIDLDYHKSSFDSTDELNKYEEKLCEDIAGEGIVLLENKGVLPMNASSTTLSLFSHSSVDFIYGGTGSGTTSTENNVNLRQGLEHAGFTVNEKLWNFYASGNGKDYTRGEGAIMYGGSEDWKINECPLSVIKAENGLEATFAGTTAVYVLSRTGGEGRDLARGMSRYTQKNEDKAKHYLEPDSVELEIIDYLNANFSDVILIVNANNAMELGWVKNYNNIKAVISAPGVGQTGNNALGDILAGKIAPSGRLVDTFAADNFSSPAMQNMGDFQFTNAGQGTGYYYVTYTEGIYVGYRYYETRYEDVVLGRSGVGNYDYASEVVYPFGYGKSYVDFSYGDFTLDASGNTVKVSVKVQYNSGKFDKAKEAVQVYFGSPYGEYEKSSGIEKSAVELCGYKKVELTSGVPTTVEIEFDKEELKSYNAKLNDGKGGYVVSAGDYYVTVASNAHEAVNNILAKKAENGVSVDTSAMTSAGNASLCGSFNVATTDTTSYAKDGDTDVVNRFAHADITNLDASAKYLSRSDWKGTFPAIYGSVSSTVSTHGERANGTDGVTGYQYTTEISSANLAKLQSTDSLNPTADSSLTKKQTFDAKNGTEFIDLRGKGTDDPLWESLLDNMTAANYSKLIGESGYLTPRIATINKPKAVDLDGPAGLNAVVGHASVAMSYPCEVLIASTWNDELSYKMGECVGEDGLATDTEGWYAPAMNIHRTPFAGRNFEYYSEDGFISGRMGAAATAGAASKGMYSFIKHFALNDQEDHRTDRGLATFSCEQAIREIYLEPFEIAVKYGTRTIYYYDIVKDENGNESYEKKETEVPVCTAIMSSFNRIGFTWAGGDYNLLTLVCRNEWGFKGFILTDYDNGGYMDTAQMLRAGGDAKLQQTGSYSAVGKNDADAYYGRQAAKNIFYCVVNSAAVNGYIHGVAEIPGFSYYILIVIAIDVLAAAGIAAIGIMMFLKLRKENKA